MLHSRVAVSGGAAPAAAFAGLVLVEGGRVVEGLGDRIAFGIDAAEQFDPPLGPLQQFIRLPQQLHALFVAFQRLVQPDFALFQRDGRSLPAASERPRTRADGGSLVIGHVDRHPYCVTVIAHAFPSTPTRSSPAACC